MTNIEAKFLDATRWRGLLFTGEWTRGQGPVITVTDKAAGTVLGELGSATPKDVEHAVSIASKAQSLWAARTVEEKQAVFRRAMNLLEKASSEMGEWIARESGGTRAKAEVELRRAHTILSEAYAMPAEACGMVLPTTTGRLSLARRLPHGLVGVIAPFNYPLVLALRAVAPALAVGNAVLLKPDPQTAVSGGVLIARLFEEAGLPPGLLQLLPGDSAVGEAICVHPSIPMIAFTGSTRAGRRVGELAGRHLKRVSLELGGKNSLIVRADADLKLAATNAAFASWMHQGQICMAAGRILVHRTVADELTQRLVEKAQLLKVGDPMTDGVDLGPLINARQVEHVQSVVDDSVSAGARLLAGGSHTGLFFLPTVLGSVSKGMRAYEEEIFGPVACVTPFDDDEQAVEMANDSDYGLSVGILSRDVRAALAMGNELRTGLLQINDQTIVSGGQIPFGGRGCSGNGSRIGGPANWEEFTQWQWVAINGQAPSYPF